jgi:hypothetical protein
VIYTLTWKEYREHRSVWFTMVVLTGLLAFAIIQLSAPADLYVAGRVALAVLGLAGAYGVVCGAMMLAGEREAGTLVFLDIFLGRRGLLWLWKALIGVLLAAAEALAVALVLHLLKEEPPGWLGALVGRGGIGALGFHPASQFKPTTALWFVVLPVVTLEAYAWGLLGSALTRRVLTGAGLAILIAFPVWLVAVLTPPPASLALRLTAAAVALIISLNVFLIQSRDTPLAPPPRPDEESRRFRRRLREWEEDRFDLERRAGPASPRVATRGLVAATPELADRPREKSVRRPRPHAADARSPGQVLLWLTFRQARILFFALAAAAVLVGMGLPSYGQVLWPLATLLLGVACGTAVFAQEQSDLSYQFLAAQHFPLRTVWKVKALFWSAVAVLLPLFLMVGGTLGIAAALTLRRRPGAMEPVEPAPLGFEFGTLRQLLGPVLFFGVWLVYGFCAGQLCVLLCRKTVMAVMLGALVALAAVGLWLPSLLCLGMSGWQVWVPPLVALAATRALLRAWAGGRIKERKPLTALAGFGLAALAWAALVFAFRAWDIPDLGEPVDRAAFRASVPSGPDNPAGQKIQEALADFETPGVAAAEDWLPLWRRDWLALLAEVSRLPVGVIETPRGDGELPLLKHLAVCRKMTGQLRFLAEVALKEGKPAAAVDHLARILALSRNLRNKAPLASYLVGVEVEENALHVLDAWLARGKPAPELLRRALGELNRHAAETPPPLDCLQTECFRAAGLLDNPTAWAFRRGAGQLREKWLADGIALSLDTPWEGERKQRLWRAVWAGLLRAVRTPHWQLADAAEEAEGGRTATRLILRGWLPADDGPGATLTRDRLARLLEESWLTDLRLYAPVVPLRAAANRARWRVDASRLAVALGLYQLREGKSAQKLEALVPNYLPRLPVDPYSGQAFRYRISTGEVLEIPGGEGLAWVRVPPGQGILWSTGPDRVDHGGRRHAGEAPDDDPLWARGGFDLITLVPRWP